LDLHYTGRIFEYNMSSKIKCPICGGSGTITAPQNIPKDLLKERVRVAKTLKEGGYSIREIMQIMNYKSPRSIQILLETT
jgi:hypothetical protein